jgi:hypothetical protein
MRVLLIVVGLVLVTAIAIAWLGPSARAPGAARPSAANPAHAEPAQAPAAIEHATAEAPGAPERSETSAPTEDVAPGIEEGGAAPVGRDFGAKYAHSARAELDTRLAALERDVQTISEREFSERFAHQGFETHAIEPNDTRGVEEIVASLKHDGELCQARIVSSAPSGDPTAGLRPTAVQIVCLARREHADLYALVEERDWLLARLEQLGPPDSNPEDP